MSVRNQQDPLFLGIDAGTSRIRALITRPDGCVMSSGSAVAPTHRPRIGWAEQQAEDLWTACCQAVKAAIGEIDDAKRVRGLAIASVGEAVIPLDRAGQPTYPVIAWYDERPTEMLQCLTGMVDRKRFFEITGLSPDPTFTLPKLLWLKTYAADALNNTASVLNIAHYLAWRLTGIPGSDHSQASRSLALDLHGRVWADDLIRECGFAPSLFPPLRPLGAKLGTILPAIAGALGLPADCAVGVGGHDHLVGALAAKALAPGTMLNSLGTAEAVTLTVDQPITDTKLAECGFNQGILMVDDGVIAYVFGGFQTSGAAIEWYRRLFGREVDHDELIDEAAQISPGAAGITFLPDLRGKLIPCPDPLARGAFIGLNADADRGILFRAILEGLAFEARQSVDALGDIDGMPKINRIRAIGGNTQNRLLLKIKASVYRQPIVANAMPEATALGAALLGGLAAGVWPTFKAATEDLTGTTSVIEPDAGWTDIYEHRYQGVYRHAYEALRPLHHATHGDHIA